MERSLRICFFSIFIVTGASLECETCAGIGKTCNGPMETCSPGFDTCAVTLSETKLGMMVSSVVKHCAQSKSCNDGLSTLNLGKAGGILSQVFCCVGTECRTMTPALTPTRNEKPNGKVCPACYAINSECEEEQTQCNGEENYCLDISGTTELGALAVRSTMKGCANSATCEELKEHSGSFSGIIISASASCKPAFSSGGHRIVPESFGLFLVALAGLQFVMYLPS